MSILSPEFPAAAYGRSEIVTLLLDRGANINHADTNVMTALMDAAEDGRSEMAAFLLEKGAEG